MVALSQDVEPKLESQERLPCRIVIVLVEGAI
jgi:hypothetical protein